MVKSFFSYTTREGHLLLFSKKSGRLYGFDKTGAAIAEMIINGEITVLELLSYCENIPRLKELIVSIGKIFNGIEERDLPSKDPLPPYPPTPQTPLPAPADQYRLGECRFSCTPLSDNLLSEIEYLKTRAPVNGRETLHITLQKKKGLWGIRFNGTSIRQSIPDDRLFPYFCDYVRIACYRCSDYLISLHAAALGNGERVIILPAVSGSGKSTLAAYLSHRGFEFFTDEVALIDRRKHLLPLPFPVAIKEGSWQTLEAEGFKCSSHPVHRRFDDQKLVFLTPTYIAETPRSVKGALLLFPKYREKTETSLKRLTTLEALAMITQSGYEVEDSFDETTVLEWLSLLESFDKYRLEYSDLTKAYEIIAKLSK